MKYSRYCLAFHSYGCLGKKPKKQQNTKQTSPFVLKSNRNQILSSGSSSRGMDGWRRARRASCPAIVHLLQVSRSTFCGSFAHCNLQTLQTDNKKIQTRGTALWMRMVMKRRSKMAGAGGSEAAEEEGNEETWSCAWTS